MYIKNCKINPFYSILILEDENFDLKKIKGKIRVVVLTNND